MPFITEEIYGKIRPVEKRFLLQTEFPFFSSELAFTTEFSQVELLKRIIMETRKTRTENRVNPKRKVTIFLGSESQKERKIVEKNIKYFNSLCNSAGTEIVSDFSGLSRGFRGVCLNWEILLPFDSEEDRLNELARLNKETEKMDERIAALEEKLSNESFVDKAPGRVISDFKKNLQENIDKRNKIRKTIDDLS
jgi:valyl-tRNA synthetase